MEGRIIEVLLYFNINFYAVDQQFPLAKILVIVRGR